MKQIFEFLFLAISIITISEFIDFSDCASVAFKMCPPLRINNGQVRVRHKKRFAVFVCYKGYILAGDKYTSCIKGQWDNPPPKCVKPTCAKIKSPPNGLVIFPPEYKEGVARYFCSPQYVLNGESIAYCDGINWNISPPTCLKRGSKPAMRCDFETEDMCGWTHGLNHDFDWRRQNLLTPSGHIGTGPSYDHTLGAGKEGYYMYIESTSRLENDTALLYSPIYDPFARVNSNNVNMSCLTMYYHMYGAAIGKLRVYVLKAGVQAAKAYERVKSTIMFRKDALNAQQGSDGNMAVNTLNAGSYQVMPPLNIGKRWNVDPLFEISGNKGDIWKKVTLRLPEEVVTYSNGFQIIIEGVRGSSYVSDMAIDDIEIFETCPQEEIATTTEDSNLYTEYSTVTEDTTNFINANTSCQDRCVFSFEEDTTTYPPNSCSCTLNCRVKNTCCPDYYITCLLDNYSTSSYELDTIETEEDSPTTATPEKTTQSTTVQIKTTIPTTTTTRKINKITYLLPKKTTIPTTLTTKRIIQTFAPRKYTIISFTKPTKQTIKTIQTRNVPTIRKVPTTKLTTTTTTEKNTPSSKKQNTIIIFNEVTKSKYFQTTEKTDVQKKFVLERSVSNETLTYTNNETMIVVIASLTLCVLLIAILLAVKYKYCSILNIKGLKKHRSSTDSVSDVRFLTSDERLDFTLAYTTD